MPRPRGKRGLGYRKRKLFRIIRRKVRSVHMLLLTSTVVWFDRQPQLQYTLTINTVRDMRFLAHKFLLMSWTRDVTPIRIISIGTVPLWFGSGTALWETDCKWEPFLESNWIISISLVLDPRRNRKKPTPNDTDSLRNWLQTGTVPQKKPKEFGSVRFGSKKESKGTESKRSAQSKHVRRALLTWSKDRFQTVTVPWNDPN